MKEYKDIGSGPVDLPWSIRHVNLLLAGVILLFPIVVVAFLFTISYFPLMILLIVGFISWVILFSKYRQTKRYEEIIVILYKELAGVEIKSKGTFGFGTLKLRTIRHGNFSLAWAEQHHPYHGASYKLWISTSRIVPVKEDGRGVIWVRPSLLKIGHRSDPNLARYLPTDQLDYISALYRIQFEVRDGESRIAAIFKDLPLQSETMDIIRTLLVLREIERRL
jgi:hypothetical protein